MRVCSEPGCPNLQAEAICVRHRRERERRRGTRQQRGYGADHNALRAHYQRRMDAGEVFYCWRCTTTRIDPKAWQLGHDDADRGKYRGPECIPCNSATASRVVSSDAYTPRG